MLEQLTRRLLPRIAITTKAQNTQYLSYDDHKWRPIDEGDLPSVGPLGQCVLLVPDSETLFRCRSFPVAHVKESDLQEAVVLDSSSWSPWEEGIDSFFWQTRVEDQWVVAVWIWPSRLTEQLIQRTAIAPTHVLPDRAWKIATIQPTGSPAIYLDFEGGQPADQASCAYVMLDRSGAPQQVTEVTDEQGALRFWRSQQSASAVAIDGDEGCAYHLLVDQSHAPGRLSDQYYGDPQLVECKNVGRCLPRAKALRNGRQLGRKDWADPLSWARPVATVVGLYILWLIGSASAVWDKGRSIAEQVAVAQSAAVEVIEQRESISQAHKKLKKIYALKEQQYSFTDSLAVLSRALPRDAWLDSLKYDAVDGGWTDIMGNAKRSAGLAAVLEAEPEIQHAMFLNDIRKDPRTGLEPFNLRLKLAAK